MCLSKVISTRGLPTSQIVFGAVRKVMGDKTFVTSIKYDLMTLGKRLIAKNRVYIMSDECKSEKDYTKKMYRCGFHRFIRISDAANYNSIFVVVGKLEGITTYGTQCDEPVYVGKYFTPLAIIDASNWSVIDKVKGFKIRLSEWKKASKM